MPEPDPDPADEAGPIARLLAIMARLRDPERGCPWDVAQDFRTIAPYTIEEAYEVADAIEKQDFANLKDELGDLLFQVVFHARMAQEAGHFDFAAVAAGISEKMIRRHPHVFADQAGIPRSSPRISADAQTVNWEAQKAAEREAAAVQDGRRPSALDGVTPGLPALTRAAKLQKRAARVGFDWPDAAHVVSDVEGEFDELKAEMALGAPHDRLEDEMGDLLFTVVNLARHLGVDPESALRRTNAKFERRFRHVEDGLAQQGRATQEATLEEMDALWRQAKEHERR
ncbi:MAG: nucleoside triphosphate pyrophosphohydrolase [Proteobacteria bacterium]|nr:nucleoside triphosphate pyrophosphohydrolase [Pseudomonadota bacterium]MDA0951120.1 nucleoside triphosphate pyrophosphohydrolase [Pseudomonadota bacterium]